MKKFIVLMIFAIGLFILLPSTSSGSGSPPDQASFVANQTVDFTAMVVNQEFVANYELTFTGYSSFTMAVLPGEGGFVADQGLFLERQHLYLNDTKPIESQIKNIESGSRCTIRADSQV